MRVIECGLRGHDCIEWYIVCRLCLLGREGGLGLLVVSHVVMGLVLGMLLGFLQLVLPSGSLSLSFLLPETVSLRPEPVRSVSESSRSG